MMLPMDELVEKYDVKLKGVVHVGAHEAQELESYLKHKADPVIWIEANPEVFKKLEKRTAAHPGHHCYQFAACDKDGEQVELNVMENTMCSSILYPKKHLELYPHVPVVEKVAVPTKTIDTLFKQTGHDPGHYNFLNMDIQGSELLALKGAQTLLDHMDYVYTEVNDDHFFDKCCLTAELEEHLSRWNFKRIARRMHPDGWGDALYRKEPL